MKKSLISFLAIIFFTQSASAITLPARSGTSCKYDANFFTPTLKETFTADGKTYLVHQRFGNYFVNGEMVGMLYNKSYKNGILNINDRPINQFGAAAQANVLIKDATTTLFIRAYTKFAAKDFEGASEDCRRILSLDANHRKATVLLTLSDAVLANKLTPENVQTISENSLDKIIKGAEGF